MNRNRNPPTPEATAPLYLFEGGSLYLSGPALVGLSRDILARELPVRFSAPGPSMSPFIRNGDIITLAPYRADSCRSGDVVAFVRPGTDSLVVHRVIGVSPDGSRIRGDNMLEEDGEIPHAYILGQAIQVERAGKQVRFGLGPERKIIALLSRQGLLPCCIGAARVICKGIRRFS